MLISHHLEDQGGERFVVVMLTHLFAFGLNDRRHIHRRGQEVHNPVQKSLNSLVLEGRTTIDRHHAASHGGLANNFNNFLGRQIPFFKELLKQVVILFRALLNKIRTPFARIVNKLRRNLLFTKTASPIIHGVVDRRHAQKIHDTFKTVFLANRNHHGNRIAAQRGLNGFNHTEEIRACAVHLVDERYLGHTVLLALPPDLLGLRLDTTHGAEQRNRTIQHTQTTLHFSRKINMSWRVDQRDLVITPFCGGRSGRNRDATLLLLIHPVHGGLAIMNFTNLVALS